MKGAKFDIFTDVENIELGPFNCWKAARTGTEPLRELAAVGDKREARECQYVVAGELTEQARAFARQKGVKLVEGSKLARLVRG